MDDKPVTVRRYEFMRALCDLSNNSNLPAFVQVDVLEHALSELKALAEAELKRDLALCFKKNGGEADDRHDDGA